MNPGHFEDIVKITAQQDQGGLNQRVKYGVKKLCLSLIKLFEAIEVWGKYVLSRIQYEKGDKINWMLIED